MMRIEGKIYGEKEVRHMLAIAPKAFVRTIRHWMYSERKKFVGNKKRKGLFRRQLSSMRRGQNAASPFRRPGKWPDKVINAIKGYVYGTRTLSTMELKMGIGLGEPSKFIQGLAMMDINYKGSREITSDSAMTLPVYENLRRRGINVKYASKLRPRNQAFAAAKDKTEMFSRRMPDGTVLYFDAADRYKTGARKGELKKSALLFVGKRKVKIKPLFNFKGQWEDGIPAVVQRGQALIDRTVRALQLGYLKAE